MSEEYENNDPRAVAQRVGAELAALDDGAALAVVLGHAAVIAHRVCDARPEGVAVLLADAMAGAVRRCFATGGKMEGANNYGRQ